MNCIHNFFFSTFQKTIMVKIGLQIKAFLESVTNLIPEEIQTEINFAEMDSHQLLSAVPKQFRLKKDLEQFQMNGYF